MNQKGQINLFGGGRGPLGLPKSPNWKWVVAASAVAYLIYSFFNSQAVWGIIVLVGVFLWTKNS